MPAYLTHTCVPDIPSQIKGVYACTQKLEVVTGYTLNKIL
jgi:hypothetical protein